MGGRSTLKDRKPRLLDRHNGTEGRLYGRIYAELEAAFGPFSSAYVRFEAGRVAISRMQLEHATRELTRVQRARRTGKGRRPNDRQVERLARRQGLADGSYAAAVKRLEELVQTGRHSVNGTDPLADLLRRDE